MEIPSKRNFVRHLLLIFRGNTVFLLHPGDFILFLLLVELFAHLGLLVVQHDQIPIRNVETGEVIHRRLSIVDILVDNERCTSSILVRPNPNLPNRAVLAENIVHLLAGYVKRQISDIQNSVDLRRQPRVSLAGKAERGHGGFLRGCLGETEVRENSKSQKLCYFISIPRSPCVCVCVCMYLTLKVNYMAQAQRLKDSIPLKMGLREFSPYHFGLGQLGEPVGWFRPAHSASCLSGLFSSWAGPYFLK